MGQPTNDRRMIVTIKRDARYSGDPGPSATLRAYPVYIDADDGRPRNYLGSSLYDEGDKRILDSFEIQARLDCDNEDPLGGEDFYGWHVGYFERYMVQLKDAEVMVKHLRRVEKRMQALTDQFGQPANFSQYLLRVGSILDVAKYGFLAWTSPSYDNVSWVAPAHLPDTLDQLIRKHREMSS